MKHPMALLSALVFATLLLTGCASTGSTPAQSSEPEPAAAEPSSEPASGGDGGIPAAEPECD